ncbi:hypothetical protein EG856_00405 [Mycoplasmopsis phocirhinis]|uniref:Lipoprotein n=1 Tax=Mycoplasmopsis phocirhinis TaxID=142650 RepID=A0A4P6MQQ7_9BACT|nr:hypothetical protein [Mycoplasmopsis phocirhinis]QBF34399.1 hypothetical protein EG856_00405 [Mycoplasmopsis phocirhinis]
MKKILKYASIFAGSILPVAAVVSCSPKKDENKPAEEAKTDTSASTSTDVKVKTDQKTTTQTPKLTSTLSEHKKQTTNYKIDPTKYGVAPLSENIEVRTLLFPAARSENQFDSEGVFRIGLHHSPVRGLTGEWVAIATEVVGPNDNTLSNVNQPVVKFATTTADDNVSENDPVKRKLQWEFRDNNKLEKGKYYTFIFYKKDGTQKIVFSDANIENSRDVFF